MVGPQPAQAVLDLPDDVSAGQAPVVDAGPDRLAGLAGDHHVISSAGEGTPEQQLGGLAFRCGRRAGPVEDGQDAVGVRGVEEVDAELEGGADDPVDVLRRGSHTEGCRAQADRRDLHAGLPQQGVLHSFTRLSPRHSTLARSRWARVEHRSPARGPTFHTRPSRHGQPFLHTRSSASTRRPERRAHRELAGCLDDPPGGPRPAVGHDPPRRPLGDADHQLLALWAAQCAEHVLHLFEAEPAEDTRPRDAIEAARAWARGEMKMMDARARGGHAMGAARPLRGAARFAAYAAGQAACVGHVPEHDLGAAAYAIRPFGQRSERPDAGRLERDWQRGRLHERIRALVLEDQVRRNAICWSVFED